MVRSVSHIFGQYSIISLSRYILPILAHCKFHLGTAIKMTHIQVTEAISSVSFFVIILFEDIDGSIARDSINSSITLLGVVLFEDIDDTIALSVVLFEGIEGSIVDVCYIVTLISLLLHKSIAKNAVCVNLHDLTTGAAKATPMDAPRRKILNSIMLDTSTNCRRSGAQSVVTK
jgi:hypothetical protein